MARRETDDNIEAWLSQNQNDSRQLLYSDEHLVRPSTNSQSGVQNNQSSTPENLARVSDQSRNLYLDFLQRQIREDEQQRSLNTSGYSYDPSDSDLSNLLRRFAQSEERQIIRQQANEVPLDSVSVENFTELLSGLFGEDGIVTYERVLVLFYFCFELCVRAIREYSSRYFHTVMDVCLRFVTGSLSIWVCAQGGWNAICNTVQHSSFGAFLLGAVVASAVGFLVWGKHPRLP
ncbi:uncharacterized protein LOC135946336 isoform X2 [Cloeon dipterum]